jgi:hypothetical protein
MLEFSITPHRSLLQQELGYLSSLLVTTVQYCTVCNPSKKHGRSGPPVHPILFPCPAAWVSCDKLLATVQYFVHCSVLYPSRLLVPNHPSSFNRNNAIHALPFPKQERALHSSTDEASGLELEDPDAIRLASNHVPDSREKT